jgi:hypothetical protein
MPEPPSKPIPENVPEAVMAFAQRILDYDASLSGKDRAQHHETFLRLLNDLINHAWDNGRRLRTPVLSGDPLEDICLILVFAKNLIEILGREQILRDSGFEHDPDIGRLRRGNLVWRMEDSDHKRIQQRVNEIRELLQNTIEFDDEGHLLSLLIAIENFQKKLHGRKSRFSLRRFFDDDY